MDERAHTPDRHGLVWATWLAALVGLGCWVAPAIEAMNHPHRTGVGDKVNSGFAVLAVTLLIAVATTLVHLYLHHDSLWRAAKLLLKILVAYKAVEHVHDAHVRHDARIAAQEWDHGYPPPYGLYSPYRDPYLDPYGYQPWDGDR